MTDNCAPFATGWGGRMDRNSILWLHCLLMRRPACAFCFILLKIIKQCCILILIHVGDLQFDTQ